MKKNRLLLSLILILSIIFGISAFSYTEVNAATKPAVSKKKVTLTTDSDPYTIQIKNLSEKATVTFKSSNKKIITVNKKTGVVKPVSAGKASVKATVKQNKKTYKLKTTFTVKKAEVPTTTTTDYKALAEATVKELNSKAEVVNAKLDPSSFTPLSKQDEVDKYVFEECKDWVVFYVYVTDLNLMRSPEEYMAKYPAITSLKFAKVQKYNNITVVQVKASNNTSMYNDEYSIDCVISNGDTSLLTSKELKLYKQLVSLGNELKGKDDYTTVKNIHDHLVLNSAYPNLREVGDSNEIHSLDNALNKGSIVCDGYAKAFYFLCRVNGIDCIFVTGTATNSSGYTEPHAWNMVKLNDKWYTLDVTWDDPYPDEKGRVLYNYFLLADEDMNKNHVSDMKDLPKANSKDLGTVYIEFKDTPSFDNTSELKKYLSSAIEDVLGGSFDITVTVLYSGKSSDSDAVIAQVLNDYASTYYLGYFMNAEGAGTMGTKYKIQIYKT